MKKLEEHTEEEQILIKEICSTKKYKKLHSTYINEPSVVNGELSDIGSFKGNVYYVQVGDDYYEFFYGSRKISKTEDVLIFGLYLEDKGSIDTQKFNERYDNIHNQKCSSRIILLAVKGKDYDDLTIALKQCKENELGRYEEQLAEKVGENIINNLLEDLAPYKVTNVTPIMYNIKLKNVLEIISKNDMSLKVKIN